jgi:hypothetical protein
MRPLAGRSMVVVGGSRGVGRRMWRPAPAPERGFWPSRGSRGARSGSWAISALILFLKPAGPRLFPAFGLPPTLAV